MPFVQPSILTPVKGIHIDSWSSPLRSQECLLPVPGEHKQKERESHNWIHTHVHATTLYQTSIKPSFHMTIWKFDPLHYARQMVGTGQSICIWTVFSVLSDRCTPKWRRHSLFPLTYICNFAFTIVSQFIRNDTLSFWQSNHDVLIVPFFHLFVNLSRKRTFF